MVTVQTAHSADIYLKRRTYTIVSFSLKTYPQWTTHQGRAESRLSYTPDMNKSDHIAGNP